MIALFDQSMVEQYDTQMSGSMMDINSNAESQMCALGIRARNQKVVKSLGTSIAGIHTMNDGYTIQYRGGDKCFYKKNTYEFTSEIRFICDHYEDEGWPMLLDEEALKSMNDNNTADIDPCHFVFEWRSKYACRHCLNSEVTEIEGSCQWYQREIT